MTHPSTFPALPVLRQRSPNIQFHGFQLVRYIEPGMPPIVESKVTAKFNTLKTIKTRPSCCALADSCAIRSIRKDSAEVFFLVVPVVVKFLFRFIPTITNNFFTFTVSYSDLASSGFVSVMSTGRIVKLTDKARA